MLTLLEDCSTPSWTLRDQSGPAAAGACGLPLGAPRMAHCVANTTQQQVVGTAWGYGPAVRVHTPKLLQL